MKLEQTNKILRNEVIREETSVTKQSDLSYAINELSIKLDHLGDVIFRSRETFRYVCSDNLTPTPPLFNLDGINNENKSPITRKIYELDAQLLAAIKLLEELCDNSVI